jgi:ATP-dependent protease ClpP protease subunit
MFKLEKLRDKAVLTMHGYVGGYYLESRNVSGALDEITNSGYKQLDFHMHTGGGDVFEGNLIYNYLAAFKGTVDIYVDGIAASMGSIMIMSVPSARVHIAENGFLMIHSPSVGVMGTAKDLIEAAKLLRSMEKNFKSKLSERLSKTAEEIDANYFDGANHWIDADEAISLGLVGNKFTAKNGAIAFSKTEAATLGLQSMLNRYVALTEETFIKPKTDMKLVNMKLQLKEDAPEENAVSAIEALEARATAAETELNGFKLKEANAKKAEAVALVDAAIAEQRITAAVRETILAAFDKDFEGQKTILASIPKRTTAKDTVNPEAQVDEALLKMSWSQADRAGRTAEMKAKYPDEYKAKFKAEFGVDPK